MTSLNRNAKIFLSLHLQLSAALWCESKGRRFKEHVALELATRSRKVNNSPPLERQYPSTLPGGFLNAYKPDGISCNALVTFLRTLSGDRRVCCCLPLSKRSAGVVPLALGWAVRVAGQLSTVKRSFRIEVSLNKQTDSVGDGLRGSTGSARVFSVRPARTVAVDSRVRSTAKQFRLSSLENAPELLEQPSGPDCVETKCKGLSRLLDLRVEHRSWPDLTLILTCSGDINLLGVVKGVCQRLGVEGTVRQITRTSVGELSLEGSHLPSEIVGGWIRDELGLLLIPWQRIVPRLPRVTVTSHELCDSLTRGQAVALERVFSETGPQSGEGLFLTAARQPVTLCEVKDGVVYPCRVLLDRRRPRKCRRLGRASLAIRRFGGRSKRWTS